MPQLPEKLGTMCMEQINGITTGSESFQPTTWEEAQEYITQEQKKPEAERDLLQKMCMLYIMKIEDNRKFGVVSYSTKKIVPIYEG